MFSKRFGLLAILMIAAMVVGACAPAAAPTAAPAPTTAPAATAAPAATTAPATTKAELPKSIVVAVIEPFTGPNAVFGEEGRRGIEQAVIDINAAGGVKSLGGLPIELIVEDSGETADSAKLAAESVVSKKRPVAILGAYVEGTTMGISEVAEREKIVHIGDVLADWTVHMGRRFFFLLAPPATKHGETAMNFVLDAAKKKGIELKTVGVINENSSFGQMTSGGAITVATRAGLEIVFHEEYPFDVTDVSSIVSGLKKANPDIVLHAPYFMDAILFAKTIDEMNYEPMFLAGTGACGYTDPDSISSLGQLAEYRTNTYSYNPAKDTPQNRKFVEAYKEKWGYIPTEGAGMNYYAMMVLWEGLELSGKMFPDNPLDGENLRTAMTKLDLTSGPAIETYPAERLYFDEFNGVPTVQAVVLQVQNGEPKVVYPFEAAEAEFVFPMP